MQLGSEDYRWLLPLTHTTDNLLYARECAMAGAGITLLPAFLVDGVDLPRPLVRVLPEWSAEPNELYLVYPSRKLNSPAMACFIEFVLQHDALAEYVTLTTPLS